MTVNLVERGSALPGASPVEAAWCARPTPGALVIPDGAWDIVADPAGGTLRLVGVMTRPRGMTHDTSSPLIGLRFRPGQMKRLLDVAAHELRDHVVPLHDVAPRLADAMQREGFTLPGMQRAVLAHARSGSDDAAIERLLDSALALLSGPHSGGRPIARVAEACGLSARRLERLFLEHVGTSPKGYQRVMRLHAALRAMRARLGLAAAADLAGYADQAHLTREMGDLAGCTPSAMMAHVLPPQPPIGS